MVGVPHERMGEALAAFVVPRPGHGSSPRELLRFARREIAGYKLPYAIQVLPSCRSAHPASRTARRCWRPRAAESERRA